MTALPAFSEIMTSAALQFSPVWRTSAIHWQPFAPFAAWLVEVLRPRSFVELGVFRGDSYCALCQAVVQHQTGTKCWGIDLWQGDDHVGHYGQEVFDVLSDYHDPLYGHFSRLVPMTFEEAVSKFEDGSVDLLHIDGHHSYESAKSNYESWLPKLSDRAVVLFHDVSVLERNFGVNHFIRELFETLPKRSFSLNFGAGLAVAVLAQAPPPALAYLCEATPGEFSLYSQLFKTLGDRVLAQSKIEYLMNKKDDQRAAIDLQQRSEAQDQSIRNLMSKDEAQDQSIRNLMSKDEAQDQVIHGLYCAVEGLLVNRFTRACKRWFTSR